MITSNILVHEKGRFGDDTVIQCKNGRINKYIIISPTGRQVRRTERCSMAFA